MSCDSRPLSSLKDTEELARNLAPLLKGRTVFLNGNLGAGKTTFVRYLAKSLGAKEDASSPTFSIANRYDTEELPIIHIDLYRIESEEELENAGLYEIIGEKATVLIEWADKFPLESFIKNPAEISFRSSPEGKRFATIRL